jgi:hypothetical protein
MLNDTGAIVFELLMVVGGGTGDGGRFLFVIEGWDQRLKLKIFA